MSLRDWIIKAKRRWELWRFFRSGDGGAALQEWTRVTHSDESLTRETLQRFIDKEQERYWTDMNQRLNGLQYINDALVLLDEEEST